jgi:hypothetical protein
MYSPPLPTNEFAAVAAGSLAVEQAIAKHTYEVASDTLDQSVWGFAKEDVGNLLSRLRTICLSLSEYCNGQIGYGIKTGLEEAFVIDVETRGEMLKRNRKAVEIIKPYLNGRDVRRYYVDFKDVFLIYTHHSVHIDEYPPVAEHLKPFKQRLLQRATKQEWYELQQPQFNYAKYFDSPKIVFPDIATSPRFALDEVGCYGSTTTFFIPKVDIYLLGLLNSKLSYRYFSETCAALEGKADRYLRFKRQYVERFPVRQINFNDPSDKARHDKMVSLVESMLALNKQLAAARTPHEQENLKRQTDATDRKIDTLVYELYGLTDEEIKIVEGTA